VNGLTDATPSVAAASVTAGALASGVMTTVGLPEPASKWRPSASWPATPLHSPRMASENVMHEAS
jgi:hypothetical protein